MFDGLKVGDKVAVSLPSRRGHAHWMVEKIGRKYFTAGGNQFQLKDGASTTGYSYPRAHTVEDHALSVRAADAERALRILNVVIDYGAKDRRDRILAVYGALKPMIDAAAAPKDGG